MHLSPRLRGAAKLAPPAALASSSSLLDGGGAGAEEMDDGVDDDEGEEKEGEKERRGVLLAGGASVLEAARRGPAGLRAKPYANLTDGKSASEGVREKKWRTRKRRVCGASRGFVSLNVRARAQTFFFSIIIIFLANNFSFFLLFLLLLSSWPLKASSAACSSVSGR